MQLLGNEVTLLKQAIRTSATSERARKLRGETTGVLRTGSMAPSGVGKLRGVLGFYTSLLMGSLGRGMMDQPTRRQYGNYAI